MAETGIPNCGNTCFMSASFQMLYSMEEFRNQIMNTDWDGFNEADKTDIEKIKALQKIFKLMDSQEAWDGDSIKDLKEAKKELIKLIISDRGETQIGEQHDAAEFLRQIFGVFENMNHLNNIKGIIEVYRAYMNKDTYCKNGDTVNELTRSDVTPLPQDMIPLSFNNKKSIKNAISIMVQETELGEESQLERCEYLNNKINETNPGSLEYGSYQHETITISNENKYIIISLNRFEDSVIGQSKVRVEDQSFNVDHQVVIDGKNFSLTGAVLHSGDTTEGGHYIYQTYNNDGSVLNTYDDDKLESGENPKPNMTLNLNSYVLLYRNDGVVSPTAAASATEEASAAESAPSASTAAVASTEEAPAPVVAPAVAPAAAPTAPIAQQKGKGKIERVVLNDGDGYWIYEGFELVNPEWVPNPKSSGGNKKSRKPKDKKIRLRKTRRRKH